MHALEEDIEAAKDALQAGGLADVGAAEALAAKCSQLHYYKLVYDKLVSVL